MATKEEFIRILAEYLVGDEVEMSIKLEMRKPEAVAWAKLRNATPLFGYMSIEKAVSDLSEFLR